MNRDMSLKIKNNKSDHDLVEQDTSVLSREKNP